MLKYCIVLSIFLVKINGRPQISLGYKPTRPFYHPQPAGNHLGQIIPPGTPWPDSPKGYDKTTQSIPNRFKEDSTSTTNNGFEWSTNSEYQKSKSTTASSVPQKQTPIILEYKPSRPFYHPNPGSNVGQIIPPQKNPNGSGANTANLSKPIKETTIKPMQTTTSKKQNDGQLINTNDEPNHPSFHPHPGNNIAQIIPPGKPWPDSLEGYKNFSSLNIEDRIKEDSVNSSSSGFNWTSNAENASTTQKPVFSTSSVLEYYPNRPPFHPQPGNNVGQIIPPGQPWPDSPAGYQNFSQTEAPNLDNRVPENINTNKPESTSTGSQVNLEDEHFSEFTSSTTTKIVTTGTISLEYKPSRPPFHPNPGNQVSQIIPPGQPWPANPEGYQNFTQNLEDRFQQNVPEIKSTSGKPETSSQSGFIWEEDINPDTFNLGKIQTSTVSEGPLYTSAISKEDKLKKVESTEASVINRKNEKPLIESKLKKISEIPGVLINNEKQEGEDVSFLIIPFYNLPPPFLYYL